MEQNTSSYGKSTTPTSAPGRLDSAAGSVPTTHRAWRRLTLTLTTLCTAAFLAGDVSPASADTALRLTTSASPATYVGNTIRATVNLKDATVPPTGTATFRLYEPGDTTCASPIYSAVVAVAGTAAVSPPYVAQHVGTYRWTTSYGGDSNYFGALPTACDYVAADVTVSRARTSLTVNATLPTAGRLYADGVLSGYSPSGSITFRLFGVDDTFCTGAPIFTSTIAVADEGTYRSAGFPVTQSGTYHWRAVYSGDLDDGGTSSPGCRTLSSTVVVG